MVRIWVFILLSGGMSLPLLAQEVVPRPTPTPPPTKEVFIREAEHWLYTTEVPDHLDRIEATLKELEKFDPKEPYIYWARARVAFWRKEAFYLRENKDTREGFRADKLALGDVCHKNADECLKLAPKNPECHLMKGVCYAMQASTWGNSLSSLRVLTPMDQAWINAIELPSTFTHKDGISTKQLAMVLRGILYRLMPESWWFRLIAGIRGDKEAAYNWMIEAMALPLRKEPVTAIELAATTICYGQSRKIPEKISEGLAVLKDSMNLPVRYPLDELDKKNMAYLIANPKRACSYRRERFEDITDSSVQAELRKKE